MYAHPNRAALPEPKAMVVGEHNPPDMVLEADHTTDARRGKLPQYEAWGFPELWVEVPDRAARSRPRRLVPGLTIYAPGKGGSGRRTGADCQRSSTVALRRVRQTGAVPATGRDGHGIAVKPTALTSPYPAKAALASSSNATAAFCSNSRTVCSAAAASP